MLTLSLIHICINRYEHQITAIGFDNLDTLADVLEVPAAYLLAESPTMADAILAVASASPKQQADLVLVLQRLSADPGLVKALLKVLKPSKHARAKIREALLALAAGGDSVSYTHLDVYKRQVEARIEFIDDHSQTSFRIRELRQLGFSLGSRQGCLTLMFQECGSRATFEGFVKPVFGCLPARG